MYTLNKLPLRKRKNRWKHQVKEDLQQTAGKQLAQLQVECIWGREE
jgi:hypothetical protein